METYRKAMQSDEWRTPKGSRHQRKYQLRQQKPNKSKQTDIQNHEVKTLQKKKKTKTEKSRAAARAAKQEWRSQRAWDDHIALLKEETELRMDAEQQERRKLRKQAEQAWNDHFNWLDDYLAKKTMLEDEEILFTTSTFTRKRKYSEAF